MKKIMLFVLVSFGMQTLLAGNSPSKKKKNHKEERVEEKTPKKEKQPEEIIEEKTQKKEKQSQEEVQRKKEAERRNRNVAYSLINAAGIRNEEYVKTLLEANANPNAKFNGETALYRASERGYAEIAKLLIDYKAITHSASCNPLLAAVQNGHIGTIELLLEHDADPNSTYSKGDSALIIAAKRSKEFVSLRDWTTGKVEQIDWARIISTLLNKGANPDLLVDGETAFDIVNQGELRKILIQASLERSKEKCIDDGKKEEEDNGNDDAPPPYAD